MSEYFFLLNAGDGINNSVSLSKLVSNRLSKSPSIINYKIAVYTQDFDLTVWKKIDERTFNKCNNITLNSSDYNLKVGQLAVIIPCNIGLVLDDSVDILPKPVSRSTDRSIINDRATVSFCIGKNCSSYQGEFPYHMSKIKGTFLAFDSLICANDPDVETKVIFINIHSNKLPKKDSFKLCLANAKSKEKIADAKYTYNSACIFDIKTVIDDDYVFYSKDTLGIPIFISYKKETKELSVEHTHPPAEYFWKNKIEGQGKIKGNWLSKLP